MCHLYSMFIYYKWMSVPTGEGSVQTEAEREREAEGREKGREGGVLGQQYHPDVSHRTRCQQPSNITH